jgi:hypothetical protein
MAMHDDDDAPLEPEVPDTGRFWILQKGRLKPVDMMTWAKWLESPERIVDKTVITDDVNVSTVFIGLDYNFTGIASGRKHLPYCWETLISGGPYHGQLWRYARRGDAKRGHWQVVDALKAGQEPKPERGMRNPFDQLRDLFEGRFDPAELERELEEGTEEADPE